MPQFVMDQSGEVLGQSFADLRGFVQGYIECMLFTETSCIPMAEFFSDESQSDIREGTADGCLPNDAGFGDLSPEALLVISKECGAFRIKASALLSQAYAADYDDVQAGRDFWYTRNGHGVGFWDRSELDFFGLGDTLATGTIGRRLSDIAKSFGETWASFEPDPDSPTGYGYIQIS